jgi:AcrR family transcriptional regulator
MGRAVFTNADFIASARALARERGPSSVTVDAVIEQLGSPKGSFYHRYASRDALLGELWLETVLAFQEGFVRALETEDGLAAALHTSAWARSHVEDARILLLYSRHDFVPGEWPETLREGVQQQAQRFQTCLADFARAAFGRAGPAQLRRATFVLADAPIAAVKPHLQQREPPPSLVDELIAKTYRAIVGPARVTIGTATSRSTR